MAVEVCSSDQLLAYLANGGSPANLRLQDVDVTPEAEAALLAVEPNLCGLVVLGGNLSASAAFQVTQRGGIVFPSGHNAPVDPYRNTLYLADDLYRGLSRGYETTPDARAYAWLQDRCGQGDPYASALRALHDDAMRDALHESIAGRVCVGVMGGHDWARDDPHFADVARACQRLADSDVLVITGGGPGAMEAANLGASIRSEAPAALDGALKVLRTAPTFTDVAAWAQAGFSARDIVRPPEIDSSLRSIGIPTWFYGHEPPNVFCDRIAKYFSNALREDDLLTASSQAVIVLPGAAGTVQEIFQAVTPMYYAKSDAVLPQLILVGREQWGQHIPVLDAVKALSAGRRMADFLHVVEDIDSAVDVALDRA